NGKQPPIVLVAGVGGYPFTFQNLSNLLGSDQPVWGLNAIGTKRDAKLTGLSIEEMADIYEPELLDAFPSGPIILGGYSFGMLPAFELAHRLRQHGRQVPFIISFESYAPGYPQQLEGIEWLLAHARELIHPKNSRKDYI